MSTVQILEIPIGELSENPNNPRQHYDAKKLEELAGSVKDKGIRQPVEVRVIGGSSKKPTYEIVFGHRRFRAAKLAGLTTVPAMVRELTDDEAFDIAVTENLQRDDMTPLDEARSYAALMKADQKRNTVAELAARFGKPESYVYRRVKLLQLIPTIQAALDDARLTIAHAERLARLTPALQKEAFDKNNGVVFDHRPLLVGGARGGDEDLGLDNLRPVHDLDEFIRQRTALKPTAEDIRHFQPDLAHAIDAAATAAVAAEEPGDDPNDAFETESLEEARASLLELSDDFFVRVHLRAKPSDPVPLSSRKWKEIKGPSNRCAFAQRGVVTHGGPYRVLEVCAKKGCPKHFPIAKKAKKPAGSRAAAKPSGKPQWQIEQERRKAEQAEWDGLFARIAPALVAHLEKNITFGADLVRLVMTGSYGWPEIHGLKDVEKNFAIKLTEKNAAVLLALATVDVNDRKGFLDSVKPFKFNIGAIEQQLKAEAKAAGPAKPKAKKKGRAA